MATYIRTRIEDFDLNNPVYSGATVTVYTVDANGESTGLLADLFEDLTSAKQLENPQALNSKGRFAVPVYIDEPVILAVSGVAHFADHESAVIQPNLSAGDADAAEQAAETALRYAMLSEQFSNRARALLKSVAIDFLSKPANLSDVPDKVAGRQNLGVEIGVDVQAYDVRISNTVHLYNASTFT